MSSFLWSEIFEKERSHSLLLREQNYATRVDKTSDTRIFMDDAISPVPSNDGIHIRLWATKTANWKYKYRQEINIRSLCDANRKGKPMEAYCAHAENDNCGNVITIESNLFATKTICRILSALLDRTFRHSLLENASTLFVRLL